MGRIIAGALLIGGALAFGGALHNHHTQFNPSNVFQREKAAIVEKYRPMLEKRRGRRRGREKVTSEERQKASERMQGEIDDMRSALEELESDGASRKQFCLFESNSRSLRAAKGDAQKAKQLRRNASYRENEHCEYTHASTINWQLGIGGAVALVLGLLHSIGIFIRGRRARMPIDDLPPARSSRGSKPARSSRRRSAPLDDETENLIEMGRTNINFVVTAIKSDDTDTRSKAADAFLVLADEMDLRRPNIVSALSEAAGSDPDEFVREKAGHALDKIRSS